MEMLDWMKERLNVRKDYDLGKYCERQEGMEKDRTKTERQGMKTYGMICYGK